MAACYYEIKAYKQGSNGNDPTLIGMGKGKRAKAKAIQKGNELWATGKYEAVFVDAYNEYEIEDSECVNIPTEV